MPFERLQKVMAACGVGSRRACEEMIVEGRVEVDGQTVTELGVRVDPESQEIRCDSERVSMPRRFYYMLNKPKGVICSSKGDPERPRAVDFLPSRVRDHRLFSIGRLDVESEGAIILTNDGELCHRVTHPSFQVQKTYIVEVEGAPTEEVLARMRKGVWLSEGRTGSLDIRVVKRMRNRAYLEVRLNEGMKREIRRVCARFGHEVRRLQRIGIGPIEMGLLEPGETRELTPEEISTLRDSSEVVIKLGSAAPAKAKHRTRGRRQPRPQN